MQLTSTAFQNIENIPSRYTGEGEDLSPPLIWSDLPTGCMSLAILCEDPDAPKIPGHDYPFVHWVLFNLDPAVGMLPEGIPNEWKVTGKAQCEQGLNSKGRAGYSGPYPPEGHGMHRYIFTLYALPKPLRLPLRPLKEHLIKGMQGLVLSTAQLVGTYEREAKGKLRSAG